MLDGVDPLDERLARLDGNGLLADDGAGVEAFVDEVHRDARRLDARRERVVDRARAGELGQQRRVHVDDALREAFEERGREQVHVAGADDDADAVLLEPVRHRRVALLPVGEALQLERARGDAGRAGPVERAHALLVRRDRDDRQLRVEERLEVRALAAHEDADHAGTILPMTRSSRPASASGTTAQ